MHWNAGLIFSDTCAIPTARSGVLNWNIWWKCAVLVSLHTPLREIPRRGILVASSREVNCRFWFLVGSIRNVTRQKDCPELQESAIPSPKICHDLGWNQKPEAKQRKSQMVDDTKSKKQHILDVKTENPNPKVAMSIKLKFLIAQWSVSIPHT